METIRAQYKCWRDGQHIGLYEYFIPEKHLTDNNARQVKAAITRQVRRKLAELGADSAKVYRHYSVYPSGPCFTDSLEVKNG